MLKRGGWTGQCEAGCLLPPPLYYLPTILKKCHHTMSPKPTVLCILNHLIPANNEYTGNEKKMTGSPALTAFGSWSLAAGRLQCSLGVHFWQLTHCHFATPARCSGLLLSPGMSLLPQSLASSLHAHTRAGTFSSSPQSINL